MHARSILTMIASAVIVLSSAVLLTAWGAATGHPEADFGTNWDPLNPEIFFDATPGAFVQIEEILVTDDDLDGDGIDGQPLHIERVCVAKTAGSTVRDRDILELRLYRENGAAANFSGFGLSADDLLGVVRNPVLTPAGGSNCPGAQFGVPGRLLFSVPDDGGEVTLYVIATFSPAAQRGDMLQLIVTMIANDDLIGAGQSSRFVNGSSVLTRTSPNTTIVAGPELPDPGDPELVVIDETVAEIDAIHPGAAGVVVQQFAVENRTDTLALLERITAYADGFLNGDPDDNVLAGVRRLRLYRESGSTGPGWQPGDELLGVVLRPDLTRGARFGGNRRTLLTLPALGEGNSTQRFYLVADFAEGLPDGAQFQFAVEVSSTGDFPMVSPPKITVASGVFEIEAPAPEVSVGEVTLTSPGKVRVLVAHVPTPGLYSLWGVISFDPDVVRVNGTPQGTWRVRGLGNYSLDSLTVDNDGGTIEFLLLLKLGRAPLLGRGEVLEIELVPSEGIAPGAETVLDIEVEEARACATASCTSAGAELVFNERAGRARINITMGDLDGDGVVTRRDARLLARWLMGRAVLTPLQKQAADVNHSCPDTIDWAALTPGGCVDATDVRWIREAAAGLRTLSSRASLQTLGRGLTVLAWPTGELEVRALHAERLSLQVFALSGGLVFNAETTTGVLRFAGLSNTGHRLAKGVYLYVVTLHRHDGSLWRSDVRKLMVR